MKTKLFLLLFLLVTVGATAQKKESKYKWSAGISLGTMIVDGDVSSATNQIHKNIFLVKPITKWFAIKVNYLNANPKGQNGMSSDNFCNNTAWASKYSSPVRQVNGPILFGYNTSSGFVPASTRDIVYYNYKTSINSVSVLGVFSFTFPKENHAFGIHATVGGGLLNYKTKINSLDANGGTYALLFKEIYGANVSKTQAQNTLKNRMDNSYETNADASGSSTIPNFSIALGFSYTIKKRYVVGIERSLVFTKSDLLDGQRWQEQAIGSPVLTRDFDGLRFNTISFSYKF